MSNPDLDPSQLIQITDLVTNIRLAGKILLDESDYSTRTKALLLTLAKLESKPLASTGTSEGEQDELLSSTNILTDLQTLVESVRELARNSATEPGAKIQLLKLQMALLERRTTMVAEMGAVEDAIKFKALVKSWFENNLPANYLQQFLSDMESLNL
jgi:hypothetical protein